jgi:hypothetical protein
MPARPGPNGPDWNARPGRPGRALAARFPPARAGLAPGYTRAGPDPMNDAGSRPVWARPRTGPARPRTGTARPGPARPERDNRKSSVSNVNLNWGVCEGQEEEDAGRDCGQALDGTRGTEMQCNQFWCKGQGRGPHKGMRTLFTGHAAHFIMESPPATGAPSSMYDTAVYLAVHFINLNLTLI